MNKNIQKSFTIFLRTVVYIIFTFFTLFWLCIAVFGLMLIGVYLLGAFLLCLLKDLFFMLKYKNGLRKNK